MIDLTVTDRLQIQDNPTTQSNQDLQGAIWINGSNAAGYKPITVGTCNTQVIQAVAGQGFYMGTSVISSVTIFTTGTFSSGSVSIYGAN
jgi:hypothetical protein